MKKIKSCFANHRGFTLSELLAVVVILSILAVMALGSFRLAVEKAHFTEGLQAAEKVAAALERFYYENSSLPYFNRIYPTMDQLDLSFSDMGDCAVVEQLADSEAMQDIEDCLNSEGMDIYPQDIDAAKTAASEFGKYCRRIGKFEVYIQREEIFGAKCATRITALRGGETKLRCHRARNTGGPGRPHWEGGYFEFSSRGSGSGAASYRDYEIDVYTS